jgi:hypothetical protein
VGDQKKGKKTGHIMMGGYAAGHQHSGERPARAQLLGQILLTSDAIMVHKRCLTTLQSIPRNEMPFEHR